MHQDFIPVRVEPKEKVAMYDEPGVLVSRIGDREYLRQFHNIRNMGKPEILFPIDIGDVHFFGRARKLASGWKVVAQSAVVVDSKRDVSKLVPVADFFASDRFVLEEMMHSMYFTLVEIAEKENNKNNDEDEYKNS